MQYSMYSGSPYMDAKESDDKGQKDPNPEVQSPALQL